MKSDSFKKLLMPIGVAVLGLAGAFATTSMSGGGALADRNGYYFLDAQHPCEFAKECSTIEGEICKSGAITLWGKVDESLPQPCQVMVFERP